MPEFVNRFLGIKLQSSIEESEPRTARSRLHIRPLQSSIEESEPALKGGSVRILAVTIVHRGI